MRPTGADDWLFDADAYLQHSPSEDWSEIPENERLTRTELDSGARAYFEFWGNKDTNMHEFFEHTNKTHDALKDCKVNYSLYTYEQGKEDFFVKWSQ